MKAVKVFIAAALVITAVSCNNSKQNQSADNQVDSTLVAPDMHTSEIAIDYYGTYEGTLPCADCEGIKTTLIVKDDNTFELHSDYLGKKDGKFEDTGNYSIINGELIELIDKTGDKTYYKIQEGSVALTNADGKLIEGELAPHYVLTKVK